MLNIEMGKELKLNNVISLRKKMTQEEVEKEMIKIGNFINENNLKKNGPVGWGIVGIGVVGGIATGVVTAKQLKSK